ncbi:hypothetical protein P175DRAFT_063241 [Aspergillus ochraceoroseus IBT 24754]|uniref:Uncharacterized protein n=3 Tax=Aspergillus subgen. Nidulantes TaxID=2720870 RepID=A0A0F8X608_9EURO|nr:uncharacterized protein P175DRAFT_063241 [Aspergillus ochraceoroseus IBT 24754]KKK19032.1 hypothetical protein ARAM_004389 [Aspergillus rambellii]KKK24862.1 hypothetical protein AOCH_002365 [Aspergillus ochraceoroseus]PTU25100.1 hypothetical protein P175DRAFT_063241 [Aspergillus ochraceoroseus IBT 24754]
MPDDRRRIILEKSRTVRRRYQRSNKRFQFSASQIARIEREEERERRAQKLREKEKRRVADKKKRAEKEAKAREERQRLGLPDPNASNVPASQPLLFNFIKKAPAPSVSGKGDESQQDTGSAGSETESTEVATDIDGSQHSELDNHELVALADEDESTIGNEGEMCGGETCGDEDEEFSDCSIFYDEDIIKAAETIVTVQDIEDKALYAPAPPGLFASDSFQDDTAAFLEEFGHEFDPGASFEQELAQLD